MTQTPDNTPWRVQFSNDKRKDLLTACWGNGKMADLLYHFLHKGSWTAHHRQEVEALKVTKFQEKHEEILKKVQISEGTLISYLWHFSQAHYVEIAPYGREFEVNFAAIEQAFTNPPEKPNKKGNTKSYKVSDCNFVTLPIAEVQTMRSEVEALKLQLEDLKLFLANLQLSPVTLQEKVATLKLATFDEATPEATPEAISDPKKNLEVIENLEEKKEEYCDGAIALSPSPQEAQPLSYSQKPQQPTLLEGSNGYEKPTTKSSSKKKGSKVKSEELPAIIAPPALPPEDATWKPGTINALFNHWRGHEPLTKGTAVQANTAAGNLYRAGYTREQITRVYEHMCQQQYWIDKGGVEIWNVANCIARELKVISKIVPFQKPGQVDVYSLSYQASRPSRLPDMYIPELDDLPQEAIH